jgi:hypothetical protein
MAQEHKEQNALVTVKNFAIATQMDGIKSVIEANLGGEAIDQFSLDKVKVPAGGGTQWEIPTITGEVSVPTIDGVIVAWKVVRSYYDKPFTGGGEPPVCSSDDGITGIGTPFGEENPVSHDCATCALNQWGSSGKTKKACQERRLLFVLRKDDHLPLMVAIPPASLKETKGFFMRLLQAGVPYWGAMVSLSLTKDKSADGIVFSRVVPKALGILNDEDRAMFQQYASFFGNVIKRVRFDPSLVE